MATGFLKLFNRNKLYVYDGIYYKYPYVYNGFLCKKNESKYNKINRCIFKKVKSKKYNYYGKIYLINKKIEYDVCIAIKNNTVNRERIDYTVLDYVNNIIFQKSYESSAKTDNYITINKNLLINDDNNNIIENSYIKERKKNKIIYSTNKQPLPNSYNIYTILINTNTQSKIFKLIMY